MRFMQSRQAMSTPTSMATVRSKMTVRKKVTSSTMMSDLGFRRMARKLRHSLML